MTNPSFHSNWHTLLNVNLVPVRNVKIKKKIICLVICHTLKFIFLFFNHTYYCI